MANLTTTTKRSVHLLQEVPHKELQDVEGKVGFTTLWHPSVIVWHFNGWSAMLSGITLLVCLCSGIPLLLYAMPLLPCLSFVTVDHSFVLVYHCSVFMAYLPVVTGNRFFVLVYHSFTTICTTRMLLGATL